MNCATNGLAGAAISSEGVPTWTSLPSFEHADAVGERGSILVVVRDDDRRQAARSQVLTKLGADVRACLRIERAERLVQKQDRRLARERSCERDALALAAGEARRPLVGERREPVRARSARMPVPSRRRRRSARP